jgi:uncharacterized YccA/Bax inhibitor family protein
MQLKTIKDFVVKFAPILGSVIETANPIAGMAIELIAHEFGADATNPNDIVDKMNADPDAKIKLQALELQHQDILAKYQADDRANARDREVEIDKITGKRDSILDLIALIVVIGYFAMCCVICYVRLDQSDHDVLYMLVGQLTGGFIMVLSYYFGASNKS